MERSAEYDEEWDREMAALLRDCASMTSAEYLAKEDEIRHRLRNKYYPWPPMTEGNADFRAELKQEMLALIHSGSKSVAGFNQKEDEILHRLREKYNLPTPAEEPKTP